MSLVGEENVDSVGPVAPPVPSSEGLEWGSEIFLQDWGFAYRVLGLGVCGAVIANGGAVATTLVLGPSGRDRTLGHQAEMGMGMD